MNLGLPPQIWSVSYLVHHCDCLFVGKIGRKDNKILDFVVLTFCRSRYQMLAWLCQIVVSFDSRSQFTFWTEIFSATKWRVRVVWFDHTSFLHFISCKVVFNGILLCFLGAGFLRLSCNHVKTNVACLSVADTHHHVSIWVETTTGDWPRPEFKYFPEATTDFTERRSCKRESNVSSNFCIVFFCESFI